MGFLGGLVSSGLTALTNGVSAYQGAQAKEADKQKSEALQQIMFLRSQHEQELKDALTQAQTFSANATGNQRSAAANKPTQGTIHQAADGTFFSVLNGVATPVTMAGGGAPSSEPSPTAPQAPAPPVALKGKPAAPVVGSKEWAAAEKTKAQIGAQYGYHPPVEPNIVSAVDPVTKEPKFFRVPKAGGDAQEIGGITPKPTTAAGAGQNAPQMAAAKANLESAMHTMEAFETKLKQDPKLYGVGAATMGAAAASPTALTAQHPWDLPMSLLGNAASAHLQDSDPELARYMQAKKYVAEAILNTHKRPNQTQYEIEQELGGIGPNPNPQQIDMTAARRKRMYEEVFGGATGTPRGTVQPQQGSAPPGNVNFGAKPAGAVTLGGGSPLRAKYDAAVAHLKATGRDAEIPNLPVPPEDE